MAIRIIRTLIYLLTAASAAVIIVWGLYYIYPGTFGALLSVAGRSEGCGFTDSARGVQNKYFQADRVQELQSMVRAGKVDTTAGLTEWSTPDGAYWLPTDSAAVLPVLLAQQDARIYGEIKPGEVVLDGGAHVGVYTRRALAAGARRVVAIEPAPDNVECLRRNFAQEIAAGRVIVYPKGVWNKDDVLELKTVKGNSAGDSFVISYGPGQSIKLPLTTIDKLVDELHLDRVDLIKLDIKGAEKQALQGAAQVLKRHRPRLAIAVEHFPDDHLAVPALLSSLRPGSALACGTTVTRARRLYPETLLVD